MLVGGYISIVCSGPVMNHVNVSERVIKKELLEATISMHDI